MMLIDPIESVMRLQNRRQQYEYVTESEFISNCECCCCVFPQWSVVFRFSAVDERMPVDHLVGQTFTDMMSMDLHCCLHLLT